MSERAANDGIEFEAVNVSWCKSANAPHLRYDVIWPRGERDGWCNGRAPRHLGPRMREQLRTARDRFLVSNPPEGGS